MRALLLACSLMSGGTCAEAAQTLPRVAVDPRIELLAVIHVLAQEDEPTLAGFRLNELAYADAVRVHFRAYRIHPAVRAYRDHLKSGVTPDLVGRLLLHCTAPPDLRLDLPGEARILWLDKKFAGGENVDRFLRGLADFARKTRFMEFFTAQRPLLGGYESDLAGRIALPEAVRSLEEYAGVKVSTAITVVFSPLAEREVGMNLLLPGQVMTLIGPEKIERGRIEIDRMEVLSGIWIEASHAVLDPLIEDFPEKIQGTGRLLARAGEECSGPWTRCIQEHVAHAVTLRLLERARQAAKLPAGDSKSVRRLTFLGETRDRLREYEEKRDRYPTLKAFYPRLLALFEDEAAASSGAKGGR